MLIAKKISYFVKTYIKLRTSWIYIIWHMFQLWHWKFYQKHNGSFFLTEEKQGVNRTAERFETVVTFNLRVCKHLYTKGLGDKWSTSMMVCPLIFKAPC